jgi:hypothetical protein
MPISPAPVSAAALAKSTGSASRATLVAPVCQTCGGAGGDTGGGRRAGEGGGVSDAYWCRAEAVRERQPQVGRAAGNDPAARPPSPHLFRRLAALARQPPLDLHPQALDVGPRLRRQHLHEEALDDRKIVARLDHHLGWVRGGGWGWRWVRTRVGGWGWSGVWAGLARGRGRRQRRGPLPRDQHTHPAVPHPAAPQPPHPPPGRTLTHSATELAD